MNTVASGGVGPDPAGSRPALPTGMVTFLFTDIEGSTVRWEDSPDEMMAALGRHNAIMRDAIDRHGGVLFETAGDSFVVAFASAPGAVAMAVSAQRALQDEVWSAAIGPLRVRMAVHTGSAEMRPDGYYAQHTLSRQARLLGVAYGGQILVSSATQGRVTDALPEAVELRDLGDVWLKDLIEPERVFQVVAPAPPWSLPDTFPPLRSARSQASTLPTAAIPFIGRERTLDEVILSVTTGTSRVTTLLGPGGIGKTRLALRVAERVQHRFVDGVHFVDLAAVTEPERVLAAIAAAVDAGDDVAGENTALERWLRDRNVLLVLDNLEQVIDVAPDIARLLTRSAGLRVLATSRIPLRILEEAEYPVDPLTLPDSGDEVDPETIAQSDAVGLFVARSTAARRDFALTGANAAVVAAICRRLEGIPLALVLAAARSNVLTPDAMLDKLEHRLTLLTDGARDLPDRHQALRDTIEWSHDLLGDDERSLYAQLAVHAGGFRLAAAEAVGESIDVQRSLDALVDASLVQATTTADDGIRYQMLETIGEHAHEKLAESGRTADAQRRHAAHVLEFAEEAAEQLEGEYIVEWGARLDEEHDNVRVALARLDDLVDADELDAIRSMVRLTAAMGFYWLDRGNLTEGIDRLERAAEVAPRWFDATDDDDDRRNARRTLGLIADARALIGRRRDDLVAARRWIDTAIAEYHAAEDHVSEGLALITLGTLSFHAGDYDEARSIYERGLELFGSDDVRTRASVMLSLGNLERDAGNSDVARSLYEQSLEIDVATSDFVGQSVSINNMANLALDAGDLDRARALHLQSLEIRYRVGARMMLAESMVGIAAVESAAGRSERAARLIGFAEGLAEILGGGFDPMERRLHARTTEVLRAELSADSLAGHRQAGRALADADAVDEARSGSDLSGRGRATGA